MNRRQFLQASTALVAASPFLTPAAFADEAFDWKQQSGKTINLAMSRHPWQEALEPLIPEFQQKTGINVAITKLPEQEYLTKVVADLTGGTFGQDVFMTQYYDAPSYQQKGWTKDLAPYLNDPKKTASDYDWEDFFQAARDVSKVGGKYTDRVAITSEAQTLVYRADVLEAAGIAVPTTFDELAAAAEKITAAGKMSGLTLRGGNDIWWPLYGVVRSYGGDYLDAALKPVVNSAATQAAVSMYDRLAKSCPAGITSYGWDEINTAMLSGQAAMFLDSSVVYSRLVDPAVSNVVGKIGIAPFVQGPAGRHGQAHFWTVSLNNAAPEPDAGWLFLQWATSKDIQGRIALKGVLGPRSSAWEVPGLEKVFPAVFLKAVQESLKSAVISPANVHFFELMDPLRAEVQDTILGNITPQKALDQVQADWQKILA
jgi:ABC-type glycerol-3-phosphate transport system substrate-binding protein